MEILLRHSTHLGLISVRGQLLSCSWFEFWLVRNFHMSHWFYVLSFSTCSFLCIFPFLPCVLKYGWAVIIGIACWRFIVTVVQACKNYKFYRGGGSKGTLITIVCRTSWKLNNKKTMQLVNSKLDWNNDLAAIFEAKLIFNRLWSSVIFYCIFRRGWQNFSDNAPRFLCFYFDLRSNVMVYELIN